MSTLLSLYSRAVDTYKPIEIDGLTFWPIKVAEMEAFQAAKPGVEIMQQSLPAHLLSLPLLTALYRYDFEAIAAQQPCSGLFARVLLFLALSLRLGEGQKPDARVDLFHVTADAAEPFKLRALKFSYGNQICEITPVQFAKYRPILAAQNGIELEADDANPELVQAERDILSLRAPKLDVQISSLVTTMAVLSRAEEEEIYQWPILKLNRRQAACKRIIDYAVCGINEGAGCKWKHGNPYPSLWFDRVQEWSEGMVPVGEFAGGAALRAMNNPGEKVF